MYPVQYLNKKRGGRQKKKIHMPLKKDQEQHSEAIMKHKYMEAVSKQI